MKRKTGLVKVTGILIRDGGVPEATARAVVKALHVLGGGGIAETKRDRVILHRRYCLEAKLRERGLLNEAACFDTLLDLRGGLMPPASNMTMTMRQNRHAHNTNTTQ